MARGASTVSDHDEPGGFDRSYSEGVAYEPDLRSVPSGALEWERTYATFAHLTLLTVHVLIPVVPAVVMWLVRRERSAFVDDHGREAVNFQISLVLYAIASGIMFFCGIGVVMMVAVYVLGIVGMVLGAVAAHKGQYFRYPMCLRILH